MSDKNYQKLPSAKTQLSENKQQRKNLQGIERTELKPHVTSLSNKPNKVLILDDDEAMFDVDSSKRYEIYHPQTEPNSIPRMSSLQEQSLNSRGQILSPKFNRQFSNRKNLTLSNSQSHSDSFKTTEIKNLNYQLDEIDRESNHSLFKTQGVRLFPDGQVQNERSQFMNTSSNFQNRQFEDKKFVDFSKTIASPMRSYAYNELSGNERKLTHQHQNIRDQDLNLKTTSQYIDSSHEKMLKRETAPQQGMPKQLNLNISLSKASNFGQSGRIESQEKDLLSHHGQYILNSKISQHKTMENETYGFGNYNNSNSKTNQSIHVKEGNPVNTRIMRARPIKSSEPKSFEFGRPLSSTHDQMSRIKKALQKDIPLAEESQNHSIARSKSPLGLKKYEKIDLSSNLYQIEMERMQSEIVNLKRALEAKDREREKDLKMKSLEFEFKIKELEKDKEFTLIDMHTKSNELISLKLKVSQYEKEVDYLSQRLKKMKERVQGQEKSIQEFKDQTHIARMDPYKNHPNSNLGHNISESADTFPIRETNLFDKMVISNSNHIENMPTERGSYNAEYQKITGDSIMNHFFQPITPSYNGQTQLLSILEEIVKSNQLDQNYTFKLENLISMIADRESRGYTTVEGGRITENEIIHDQASELENKTELFKNSRHEPPISSNIHMSNFARGNIQSLETNPEQYFESVNTFNKNSIKDEVEHMGRSNSIIEEEITALLKRLRKQVLSDSPEINDLDSLSDQLGLDLKTEFLMIINGFKDLRQKLLVSENDLTEKSQSYNLAFTRIRNISENLQKENMSFSNPAQKALQEDFVLLYNKVVDLGTTVNIIGENSTIEDVEKGINQIASQLGDIYNIKFQSQEYEAKEMENIEIEENLGEGENIFSAKIDIIESHIYSQNMNVIKLQEDYNRIKEELSLVHIELTEKAEEKNKLQKQIQSYRELSEFLETERTVENREILQLRELKEELEATISNLGNSNNEKEKIIKNLGIELSNLREEIDNLKQLQGHNSLHDSNYDSIGFQKSPSVRSGKNSENVTEENVSEKRDLQSFHCSNVSHKRESTDEIRITVNSGQNPIRIDRSLINLDQLANLNGKSQKSLKKSLFMSQVPPRNTLLNEIEESSQLMKQETDQPQDLLTISECDPLTYDEQDDCILIDVIDEKGNAFDIEIESFIREIVETHKRKVEELERELSVYRESNMQLVAESNELKIINQKLKIETFKIVSLQRENQELIHMLESNDVRNRDYSNNQGSGRRITDEIQEFQLGEGDSFNNQRRDADSHNLQMLIQELNGKIEELSVEVHILKSQNTSLQAQYDETLDELVSLKQTLPDNTKNYSEEKLEELRVHYKSALTEIESLQEIISSKTNMVDKLIANIEVVKQECDEAVQSLHQSEQCNIKLTSRIQELDSQIKESKKLKQQIESLKQSESLSIREASLLKRETSGQKIQIANYEDELDRLQNIISGWNQERSKYLDEIFKLSQISEKERSGPRESNLELSNAFGHSEVNQIHKDLEEIQKKFNNC
jgi:hypothetical protein